MTARAVHEYAPAVARAALDERARARAQHEHVRAVDVVGEHARDAVGAQRARELARAVDDVRHVEALIEPAAATAGPTGGRRPTPKVGRRRGR